MSAVRALLMVLALVCAQRVMAHAEAPLSPELERQAQALFGRLRPPCCYAQTLDVHESDGAALLRSAIRQRLSNGETVAQIEANLVETYGPRIRAMQRFGLASASCDTISLIVLVVPLALVLLGRRWRDRYLRDEPVHDDDARDEQRLDEALARDEDAR